MEEEEEETILEGRLKVKGLNILGLNIQSLYPKKEQIEHMLESEKIGILVLTESWLSKVISNDAIRISDYKVYRLDRQRKIKGGHLCLYTQKAKG